MRFPFWWWRRNEELDEEIQGHLELAARENMESGLAPRDAQTAARHEFGSIALAEEVTVSYTHLDVYKRQVRSRQTFVLRRPRCSEADELRYGRGCNRKRFPGTWSNSPRAQRQAEPMRRAGTGSRRISHTNAQRFRRRTGGESPPTTEDQQRRRILRDSDCGR